MKSARVCSRSSATYPGVISSTSVGAYCRAVASKWRAPIIDVVHFDHLTYTTSVSPQEYLRFAQQDLRLGGARGLINGLANSKRAIDCQITNLLQALGIPSGGNFPSKLEKVEALGIVAPRILMKVARARNSLEHNWRKPSGNEVGDAVDIATLFIAALQPLFSANVYMNSCWIVDEKASGPDLHVPNSQCIRPTSIHVDFYDEEGCIQLLIFERGAAIAEQWIDSSTPAFIDIQGFFATPRAFDYDDQLCDNNAKLLLAILQRV